MKTCCLLVVALLVGLGHFNLSKQDCSTKRIARDIFVQLMNTKVMWLLMTNTGIYIGDKRMGEPPLGLHSNIVNWTCLMLVS